MTSDRLRVLMFKQAAEAFDGMLNELDGPVTAEIRARLLHDCPERHRAVQYLADAFVMAVVFFRAQSTARIAPLPEGWRFASISHLIGAGGYAGFRCELVGPEYDALRHRRILSWTQRRRVRADGDTLEEAFTIALEKIGTDLEYGG